MWPSFVVCSSFCLAHCPTHCCHLLTCAACLGLSSHCVAVVTAWEVPLGHSHEIVPVMQRKCGRSCEGCLPQMGTSPSCLWNCSNSSSGFTSLLGEEGDTHPSHACVCTCTYVHICMRPCLSVHESFVCKYVCMRACTDSKCLN